MPLELTTLEDRVTPANVVPAGEFNWLQATPTGGLSELVWEGVTLTYRTRAGTGWDEEPVVTASDYASSSYTNRDAVQRASQVAQLAFTPDGTPHAFLLRPGFVGGQSVDTVAHYTRGANGWAETETISLGPSPNTTFFLPADNLTAAVGPGGVFHLLAHRTVQPMQTGNVGQGQLLYATNKSGSWAVTEAARPGDQGQDVVFNGERYAPRFLSIAADSQNFAHITYSTGFFVAGSFNTVRSDLGYATNRTGTWVPETVYGPPDGTGDAGLGASIAIGPGDVPAIASYFVDRVATGSPAAAQLLYHFRGTGGWAHGVAVAGPDGYVAGDGPNYTGFSPQLRFEGGSPVITFSDEGAQHLTGTGANEMAGQVREARLVNGSWLTATVFRQDTPLVNELLYPVSATYNGRPLYAGLRAVNALDGNGNVVSTAYDLIDVNAPQVDGAEPGLPGGPPGAGAIAADAGGGPLVKVFNDDGTRAATFFAFDPAFAGGVRLATADVNGDHVEDVIVGTGPGAATRVKVFSGVDQSVLLDFAPFEAAFVGGVYVAAGDLTGDGTADIVVTPDQGGGPRVSVYRGGDFAKVADFFGIDDPNFRGGARAAVGDIDKDARADLLVAAGFGGGPRVAAFDGKTVTTGQLRKLFNDFFVFEDTLRNGAFVALGDVDGDGHADLVAGGGPGGGPRVLILDGADLAAGNVTAPRWIANFYAGSPDKRGGVRVATDDLDGDAKADVLAGAGQGDGNRVQSYLGATLAAGDATVFRGFSGFPGFSGGVFVG
jgi:hypothetical protein